MAYAMAMDNGWKLVWYLHTYHCLKNTFEMRQSPQVIQLFYALVHLDNILLYLPVDKDQIALGPL